MVSQCAVLKEADTRRGHEIGVWEKLGHHHVLCHVNECVGLLALQLVQGCAKQREVVDNAGAVVRCGGGTGDANRADGVCAVVNLVVALTTLVYAET